MAGPEVDFKFGFNDPDFSDRILRIEIIADSLDSEGDCIPNKENTREENVAQVKTLHVSSIILAANSPFFYKLFKNGMRESHQRDATMRIDASEDAALMDILGFMYSNTLGAISTPDLVGVLMVADKFGVTSCMSYCSRMLQKTPMSLEYALLYLKLCASVSVGEVVQPLIDVAKEYVVERYSDFNKSKKEEAMELPLCALELVLGSEGLQVDSEDDVFDFVLEWVSGHYPKLEERRDIITKHLSRCICFSCMSCPKLKEAFVSADFDHEQVSKLVIDALFCKAKAPYLQHTHTSKDTKCTSLGRVYKRRPIKVVPFEFAQPRCVVYFDLRKEECENLFQSTQLYSESFCLGGRWFYLIAKFFTKEQQNSFALHLCMTKESESCCVDYEFAVMNKSSKQFQMKGKGDFNNYQLIQGYGYPNLLGISWTDFMSKDCEYFIDGFLHLRADLTIDNAEA